MQKQSGHTTGKGILILAAVILYTVLAVLPVQAHNLWLIGDADGKGSGLVHLYFEHHIGPGDGAYNGPIVERGKTWLRRPDKDSHPVELKEITEGETKYLTGSTGPVSGSYALDHTSLYGIYAGRLDFFHGRFIKADTKEDLEKLAESSDVPVQIIPSWTDKGLMLQIKYFALPWARTPLWMMQPEEKGEDGKMKEKEMQTNSKGEVLIGKLKPGTYHFSTRIVEDDPAGAFENQAYKGLMHGSTLTLKLGSNF
ncbi:MAG: hypothetical protein Q3M24_06380 [Candidatus Electrothrix aestuarii]|uniref:Nickel transport protein n=1 Tax=Candidatus Electrothrix aestuarii TaxID=3062594 RepID=A0AAU8LZE4_9BACT|nr:MAG: hypothetical protein SD837_02045 [Candidatus Electrothrix sp. GW3-3]